MKHRDFPAMVDGERHKLVSYVRSLMTESADFDAEDVVQDVLVGILERADSAPPLDNVAAYVYRALKNRVIDHIRTRRTRVSLDDAPEGVRLIDLLHDVGPGGLEALQSQQGRRALFEALASLKEPERRVVVAHELEGRPFKELSREWQVPVSTLLSHKSRAMKKLRKYFASSRGGA